MWCVQNEADYRALAGRLPNKGSRVKVTVYITRADGTRGFDLTVPAAAVDGPVGGTSSPRMSQQPVNAECSSSNVSHGAGVLPATLRRHSTSSLAPVSLAATLVSLPIGHWGWESIAHLMDLPKFPQSAGSWLHTTLIGYTLSRRCLPIALIIASIVVMIAVCRCIVARSRRRASSRHSCCWPTSCTTPDMELGAMSPRREPQQPLFMSPSSSAQRPLVQSVSSTGASAVADEEGHDVRAGRPDLSGLLREATAGLENKQLVVVAACGPTTMVEAARKAVAAARKECRGVRLEFSGSESKW